jgi:hypothetical protein
MDPYETLALCDLAIIADDLPNARELLRRYRNGRSMGAADIANARGTILTGDEYAESCSERIEQIRQARRDAIRTGPPPFVVTIEDSRS